MLPVLRSFCLLSLRPRDSTALRLVSVSSTSRQSSGTPANVKADAFLATQSSTEGDKVSKMAGQQYRANVLP